MNKGFTLLEVIIYIALFSFLMGTAFIAVYQLIENSDRLSVKNITQEEGNFVLRKINWALTGASSFTNTLNTLHIDTYNGNQINIALVGTKIQMTESMGSGAPGDFITTDKVTVSSLQFTSVGGTPGGVTMVARIDGVDFTITKYIRK